MKETKRRISQSALKELAKNSVRLSAMIWKEGKGAIAALGFIFLIVSAAPFLQSGTRGLLINELVRITRGSPVGEYLLLIIGFLVAAAIIPPGLFLLQSYFLKRFWFFIQEKFEILLLKKRGEIDVAVHEDPRENDLFQKVTENGIWRIQNFIDRQFYLFQNLLQSGIAAVILGVSHPWVFGMILIASIPELAVEAQYGRDIWSIYGARAEVRRRFWDLHRHFEWLPSLVELKLFQNTKYFLGIIKELFTSFQNEEKRNERRKLIRELFSLFFSQAAIALATILLIRDVVHGTMQIGTLTFLLASISELRQSLSSLFSNLGRQYQDSLFVSDVFRLLDVAPVIPRPARGIVLPRDATPEIRFEHVTFRYPGTDRVILRDISLTIPAGEKVALVGINGAGKTTLVKLLCRFYDPDEGRVLIDGHDLREIDLDSWYPKLGAIFQDYAKYHFLVSEAIALGDTERRPTLEQVKHAARVAEADAFIEEWEKEYEQMLGKEFTGGIEPSVGQWQKLALARTFYRDPRILILDEPTASIDAEAEARIFDRLESLPDDRTVILISHRFSTVRHADTICVIEHGTIRERGSHEELLARGGTYAKLFALQAKGYQ